MPFETSIGKGVAKDMKLPFKRGAALAASLVLVGVVLAVGASAGNPHAQNCNTADGKINGRGATFQERAQDVFRIGFNLDVCGTSTPGLDNSAGAGRITRANVSDPPNSPGMAVYNYDGAT